MISYGNQLMPLHECLGDDLVLEGEDTFELDWFDGEKMRLHRIRGNEATEVMSCPMLDNIPINYMSVATGAGTTGSFRDIKFSDGLDPIMRTLAGHYENQEYGPKD
jgi:hypothetical protein